MLIRGKGYWCKIIGKPMLNKFAKKNQWSFDLSVDKETVQKLLEKGMRKSYIKNKGDEKGDFLSFNRNEFNVKGEPSKAYEIQDAQGQPWPEGKLIGNGSTLNVIVSLNERTNGTDKWLAPSAIKVQVWDAVPFAKNGSGSDFPTKEVSSEGDTSTSDSEW